MTKKILPGFSQKFDQKFDQKFYPNWTKNLTQIWNFRQKPCILPRLSSAVTIVNSALRC